MSDHLNTKLIIKKKEKSRRLPLDRPPKPVGAHVVVPSRGPTLFSTTPTHTTPHVNHPPSERPPVPSPHLPPTTLFLDRLSHLHIYIYIPSFIFFIYIIYLFIILNKSQNYKEKGECPLDMLAHLLCFKNKKELPNWGSPRKHRGRTCNYFPF